MKNAEKEGEITGFAINGWLDQIEPGHNGPWLTNGVTQRRCNHLAGFVGPLGADGGWYRDASPPDRRLCVRRGVNCMTFGSRFLLAVLLP